jgi:hypothetical protein
LSDATSGATIYYTTNGIAPTTASTPYSGAIAVSATETVEAIAVANGYTTSVVASGTYTITPTAATPTFPVAIGTYTSAQQVAIVASTPGAAIYYTTDNTTPTTSSNLYTGAIPLSTTTTVKAIAVASGYNNSPVASATYNFNLPAASTPAFSLTAGTYTTIESVTLSDATSGAAIYYTTNGIAPTTASTPYTGAISVSASETVEAIAVAPGYNNSAVGAARYLINLPAAARPTFSVAAGTYTTVQSVTLSDTTAGAAIYYTTNSTAPTTSSTLYTGPIPVSSTETIEAIAVASGYSASAPSGAKYTITLTAARPSFSVAAGTYTSIQSVTLTTTTAGATIYYTTNATTPTTSSTAYTGPITVSATQTIEAIAAQTGYVTSGVAGAGYTLIPTAARPTFPLAAGTYTSIQSVTLASTTQGATIYYTTNGTAPTTSSAVYTGPISVSTTEVIEAISAKAGYITSEASGTKYTITLTVAKPALSVAAGMYNSSQTLTLSDATPGAVIYYTTNGTTPTTSSAVYSGPIAVTSTQLIEAIGVVPGYVTSQVTGAKYTIE